MVKPLEQEHGNQSCPNLDVERIGAGTDEAFDFEILFDRFKEHLNLPSVSIDLGDGGGPEIEVVGEQHERLFTFDIDDNATKLQDRAVAATPLARKLQSLIGNDVAVFGQGALIEKRPVQIVAHANDKKDAPSRPVGKQLVIDIAAVHHDD